MNVNDLAIIEGHQVTMLYLTDAWTSANDQSLSWQCEEFSVSCRGRIPRQSGVYAFVVDPELFSLTPANGLFYIGKATNLYDRIGAYFGELNKELTDTRRPHVWKMLNRWNGHLKYYYTLTENAESAGSLENVLLSAFRPPFNKQYDASVSQIMRAFQ